MKVLIKAKTSFNTIELSGVTSIAFSGNIYTISHAGGTSSFNANDYLISIFYN